MSFTSALPANTVKLTFMGLRKVSIGDIIMSADHNSKVYIARVILIEFKRIKHLLEIM